MLPVPRWTREPPRSAHSGCVQPLPTTTHPHASRPRSVPPTNPPAPCTVTLPAHRPPASHRRPPHSACRRPANRCLDFQPAACAAHPAPNIRRDARAVTNHAHPSLARGCPRRQSSLARLRSPMWLRTAVSSRAASSRALPQAQPSALAALALAATAANAAPTARVASGCPSGQRTRHPPSCRKGVLRVGRGFRAPACVLGAPREVAASPPRFARTAPRPAPANAFASLTPPREPPAPFANPSRAAAFRFCHHPATPAALPFPRRPPHASGVEWLAMLAPMTSKGARRRALASPLAREELHCALRLPAPVSAASVAPVDATSRESRQSRAFELLGV